MTRNIEPIRIQSCPKSFCLDLDKATDPDSTIQWARRQLDNSGLDILDSVKRVDNGRLGIPVYMSVCGSDARALIPGRKQMGKGSSPEQARASAIMELMERYAFFGFWQRNEGFVNATWLEAEKLFGENLIPIEEILLSVQDTISADAARQVMNLLPWQFFPATRLKDGQTVWLPLDWFRLLGEFNGTSAGNTPEESLLQGIAELLERHVSCLLDRGRITVPTINPDDSQDQKLRQLINAFRKNGINLILKDISLGMPMPTVAALAWDDQTFPQKSEIVFTAGTASSPQKAAIRAITEVAQLGGDFNTSSCYEASGLGKFFSLEECGWLLDGPEISLNDMPSVADNDIYNELMAVIDGLAPMQVYGVDLTDPVLKIPAHYSIIPGLQFRERDINQSVGLFAGRKLAENADYATARAGLETLGKIYPQAHFLPFFQGLASLRQERHQEAAALFETAIPRQPDMESRALAEFYTAHALSQDGNWAACVPYLENACRHSPQMREYANLLGVAHYRLGDYEQAEQAFDQAIKLDPGSAMDIANRGVCRKLQGKNELAMEDLMTALSLDESLDFARQHLLDLHK